MKSVSIIGGGVGGLSLAALLAKKGLRVNLFERTPEIKSHFSAPSLLTSGAVILKSEFGLHSIGQISSRLDHQHLTTTTGFHIGEVDLKPKLESWGIYNQVGFVQRDDLAKAIAAQVPKDSIRFGQTFEKFEQDETGVTVHLKGGHKERSDLLIGADGAHSTVRKQLFGDSHPKYEGLGLWYGLSKFDYPHRNGDVHLRYGKGFAAGYFGVGEEGQTAVFCIHALPQKLSEAWTVEDLEASKKELHELLKEDGEVFKKIVDQSTVLAHVGLYHHQPLHDAWHQGRVALLGDATHPTLPTLDGHGADLAIEDAALLANLIERFQSHGGGVERLFSEYYRQRYHKSKAAVAGSVAKAHFDSSSHSWYRNSLLYASVRSGGVVRAFKNAIASSSSHPDVAKALQ